MSSKSLLRLKGVSKSFAGVHALTDVSLDIDAGEVVCFAGENGSGKSTLVKVLAGVAAPNAGTIEVDGRIRSHWQPFDAMRAGVQVIYQDFSLFPNLTVAENISFNYELAKRRRLVAWRDVRLRAKQALEKVGVAIDLDTLVERLSVADKQVVAIARALAGGARLIAMDEPTTALTEREVQALLAVVRRLKEDDVAVVFISHKLPEVFAIAERIIVLRNGRKVAEGPTAEFDVVSLSEHMLGRKFDQHAAARRQERGPSCCGSKGSAAPASSRTSRSRFRAGDVLGVTGLLGSGRDALAKALFGLAPADRGRIVIGGRE